MSFWTKITGTIKVSPMGRTQHEKDYILKTVLDHLPMVTGSEHDMNIYINQCRGYESHFSCNELEEKCMYQKRRYNYNNYMTVQDEYLLTVDGYLRDRLDSDTVREFSKWLCRLAKRIVVLDVCVTISGNNVTTFNTFEQGNPYYQMFEDPSWTDDKSHNWCERLMW